MEVVFSIFFVSGSVILFCISEVVRCTDADLNFRIVKGVCINNGNDKWVNTRIWGSVVAG